MKSILIMVTALLYFNSNAISRPFDQNDYPEVVKRLGIEKLYNHTKWLLYCIHSDETPVFTRSSKIPPTKLTFGMLPLEFDHVEVRGDTVEIDFVFLLNGTKLNASNVVNSPYWGAIYKGDNRSIVAYSSTSHARYIMRSCFDEKKCHYKH